MAIMGMPGYEVTRGDILFQGESILPLTVEERAKMGIGMAFQKMPVIPGVKLKTLGEIIVNGGSSLIEEVAEKLNCTYLLERSIGLGFSGGEAKRAELFQLFLQRPLLSLIDEMCIRDRYRIGGIPFQVLFIFVPVLLILHFLLSRTAWGRKLYGVGSLSLIHI